ncbi:MAG: peptide/nickel transport system substrate-binding protein [Thermomicrobiales bacterium]|nr:peptide/nickel transport system substrate-binding protein [Thermomicrobiales bacterium]
MTSQATPAVKRLMAEAIRGRLSRRQLIGRGLALGLSVPTLTTLVAMHPGRALAAGGGTLKIAFAIDLQFLDPQLVQSDQDLLPSTLVFSRLVQWDSTMLEPKPDVAESWTISDDNLTYAFTLRQGVKFHSGREVTADDVVFSYQRALDTGDKGRGKAELRDVESFTATGPLEFTVKLKQPSAVFLASNGHWALPILNKDTVADVATKPDGTGPFTFVEWVPGDHVTYTKNPDYWNSDALANWPDEIVSQPIPEPLTRIANLKAGQTDLVQNVPAQLVADLEKDTKVQLIRQPFTASYWCLNFNLRQPPFDNVKVRQAVARAIDKEAIHQNVFYGTGEVGCSLIPSTHWAFDPSIECAARDVEAAKALMQEAGVGELKVTFKFGGNDAGIEAPLAEILKQNLAEIGIDLELQQMEPGLWLQEVWLDKNFEMTDAWYTREPDPDGLMQSVLRKDGGNNVMGYDNPEIETLFDQGKSTLDQEARKPIYSQIIKTMLDDTPLIKLQTVEVIWAGNHKVSGMQVWPKGMPNYLDYTFDPNG